MDDSSALNRAHWDERAPAHAASPGYHLAEFIADPGYLSEVVRFDLPRLGDIAGRRGVHLQCHIGTDTVSLARLGAHMTGLDFSATALAEARRFAGAAGCEIEYVESDVYDAVGTLGGPGGFEPFDFVYTGIGALCWLPDIARWAGVVADLLRPGGRLFVREGHPVLWSLDEYRTDALVIGHPYFERPEPIVDESEESYVATDVEFRHNRTHSWNHGLGETITALLAARFEITALVEHDSVPWIALPGQMVAAGGGEWQVADRPWRLPHTFTLQAVKR